MNARASLREGGRQALLDVLRRREPDLAWDVSIGEREVKQGVGSEDTHAPLKIARAFAYDNSRKRAA